MNKIIYNMRKIYTNNKWEIYITHLPIQDLLINI